jgi:hypothetical protein
MGLLELIVLGVLVVGVAVGVVVWVTLGGKGGRDD